MASDLSHSDSQIKLIENEILTDKTTMNIEQDEEEEEATVPKLSEQTFITTPLLSNNGTLTRQISLSSSSSKSSDYRDICRICHCEGTNDEPLISPCSCLGTMQYLHQACLQRWIKSAGVKSCELCKFEFIMHSEIKPFKQWQKLDMNVMERRKIMCSVAFNLIAVTCVLWSLYVLIEKTREEVKQGKLQWPFWTKLIVVAIGFTGGLVFLYVQCKMYLQLCLRWRQFNQRIVIHSISEQRPDGILSSSMKNTNNNSEGNCIITVLDANDLLPLNSNTPITAIASDSTSSLPSSITNRNQRLENNNNNNNNPRNILHSFLIFHRSDQSQT